MQLFFLLIGWHSSSCNILKRVFHVIKKITNRIHILIILSGALIM